MSETAVAVKKSQEIAAPKDLLGVIAAAVADPRIDVEKMERLLAMHERITTEQRRIGFMAALSRIQAAMPQISKKGVIYDKLKNVRSRFAKVEDIDAIIRPMLRDEGFSLSFDSTEEGGKYLLSCTLAHEAGHSETKSLVLPLDKSEYRTAVQSVGSTVSYGRRQLTKMHLNIIEAGEDDDGTGGSDVILEQQALDIEAALTETKSNRKVFLEYMGVSNVAEILVKDLPKATEALERKRRQAS